MKSNRHIRLLTGDRTKQPEETPFVVAMREQFYGMQPNLRETLLHRVQPWQGMPWRLFEGLLRTEDKSCYIAKPGALPRCSVGYWLSDGPLALIYQRDKPYYQLEYAPRSVGRNWCAGVLHIPYVGFAVPLSCIPAHTLLRVSLARWWKPEWAPDERCYLQLSGWYT